LRNRQVNHPSVFFGQFTGIKICVCRDKCVKHSIGVGHNTEDVADHTNLLKKLFRRGIRFFWLNKSQSTHPDFSLILALAQR
jgi:hypothetical protein